MKNNSQETAWQEQLETWVHSAQTREIHTQLSRSLEEVKAKSNRFERGAIKKGLASLKSSWSVFRKEISQFERNAAKKDVLLVNESLKKFFS